MVFSKLFGRKNNDNYNEDLLNQKHKEAQEEIETYKENINKKTNQEIDRIIDNNSKNLIKDIEEVLIIFKKQREKILENPHNLKILIIRLEGNKKLAISMLNSYINFYKKDYKNIESKHYKDVLEAYENAIKEIKYS